MWLVCQEGRTLKLTLVLDIDQDFGEGSLLSLDSDDWKSNNNTEDQGNIRATQI